jgi:hypothetical protein
MRPQALQHGRNQTVHFVLALPVEDIGRRITCKQSRTTANHTWPVGSSRQGRIQIASAERRLLAGDPFLLRRAAAGGHAGVWPQGLQITADR